MKGFSGANVIVNYQRIIYWLVCSLGMFCTVLPSLAHGAIAFHGDSTGVSPTDPNNWNSFTKSYVGKTTAGTVTVDGGDCLESDYSYIGHGSSAPGVVSVSGNSSSWVSNRIYIGYNADGTLTLNDGSSATSASYGYIAYNSGANGSTALVDHASWSLSSDLYVGYYGNGSLIICNGGTVSSQHGSIGYTYSSTSTVTVSGPGSTWNNTTGGNSDLYVGKFGRGTLSISNGGAVRVANAVYCGFNSDSSGVVTIDGSGSILENSNEMILGSSGGSGMLSITGGGSVSTGSVNLASGSLLAIDAGRGSALVAGGGTGNLINDGIVRLLAGAGAAADNYTPILSGAWSGVGSFQAVGGSLDVTSHIFTVSEAVTGTSGIPLDIDLTTHQRAMIVDGSGWIAGASFWKDAALPNITLTASVLDETELVPLGDILTEDETVLGAWDFVTTNYQAVSGDPPVYLSFKIGEGQSIDTVDVWRVENDVWTAFDAGDLTYDGVYASFTTTDLGSYAMTGVIMTPEPEMLAIIAAMSIGLFVALRRRL